MSNPLHSLAVRSLLAQLLGLSLVLSIVGVLQLRGIRQSVRAEAARVGETAAAIFREEISQDAGRLDPAVLQPLADRLAGRLVSVSRIRFTDAAGRVVADAESAGSATRVGAAPVSRAGRIEIVTPISGRYDGSRRSDLIGTVGVEIDLTLAERRVRRTFLQSMALLLGLLPAYALVWYLLTGRSTQRRLRRMAEAAAALSAGNYRARTDIDGPDEIGRLGSAFDEMASRLSATHARLQQDIDELNAADNRIRELNHELEAGVAAVQAHNRALGTLNELSKVMQSCTSVDEALSVIPRYVQNVLADASGGVYLLHPSRDHLELTAAFGAPTSLEHFFHPDRCWGLRLGRAHVSRVDSTLVCGHLQDLEAGRDYHCAPLLAQSDALGMLHVQFESEAAGDAERDARTLRVVALAEQLGIALANLQLRETLRQQSIKDPLTNLFNRRYLEETLQREIERARRTNSALTAIMLDVDNFKRFNDTFGHDAGDHVLALLGRQLASHTRASDIACRYGGEEFALILPSAPLAEGMQRAEELRGAVHALHLDFMGRDVGRFSISLGVAELTPEMRTGAELLKVADELLFEAKARGRNQVVGAARPASSDAPGGP